MKKLIMTAAVVACAAVVTAQTVTSANIVGYAKKTAPAAGAFDLMALAQFTDGSNAIDIQSIISNLDSLNSAGLDSDTVGADKLYVWTGTGYATYALFYDATQTANPGPFWASTTELGWINGYGFLGVNAAVATVDRGASMWLETGAGGASGDVLTSGEVPQDGTFDMDVDIGFTLISYPYTSSINVNSLTVSNSVSAGLESDAVGADKLYVWTGTGYATYALFYDATQTANPGPFWASTTELGWIPGYGFLGVNPANAVIGIGNGFWYGSDTHKTIGFAQNY